MAAAPACFQSLRKSDQAPNAIGRITPALLFLALIGLAARSWILLVPMALTVPRLPFQLSPQWRGILAFWKAGLGL